MSNLINRINLPPAPMHVLSALVTVAIDILWGIPELAATLTVVGVPLVAAACGLTTFASVALTQKYVAKEDWGQASAKGLALGVLAALPYPVMGTAAGAVLASWSGINQFLTNRQSAPQLPSSAAGHVTPALQCGSCGNSLRQGAKFCTKCGQSTL